MPEVPNTAVPPHRLLLGPGPSPVHPRVLEAQARNLVGHLDPWFLDVADQVAVMLRAVFRTDNRLTYAVSGTGSAGMETAVVNLVEPGDVVIVGVNGVFGGRFADAVGRVGGDVVRLDAPWGAVIDPARVDAALRAHPEAKLVAVVHAETSTGAHQPLEEIATIVAGTEALFVVDSVTGLAGVPLETDGWGLDVVFSGTQKCLSVPPGLAPITFSAKAQAVLETRQRAVPSWYFDVAGVRRWWETERAYHHTAPVGALLGLHEGLRLVLEEGIEQRWARHAAVGLQFQAAVEDRGYGILCPPEHRLPQLTAVVLPSGIDETVPRRRLLTEYGIEVGGGLGELSGRAWRVGLMGEGATEESVHRLLAAMDAVLSPE